MAPVSLTAAGNYSRPATTDFFKKGYNLLRMNMHPLYPYDDVLTADGYLWAVDKQNDELQAVVAFDDTSQRFLDLMTNDNVYFILRSRLCQLGLNCKLKTVHKSPFDKKKLECNISISISNSEISKNVGTFILNSKGKLAIGKLFLGLEGRKLNYKSILQSIYASESPLIDCAEILPGTNGSVIVNLDQLAFNFSKKACPSQEQIDFLLTSGTRKDLDIFRNQQRTSLPHKVSPQSWYFTQLPFFRLYEHFAIIDSPTLGTNRVKSLQHASARLFDPLSKGQEINRPMIEVINTSDKEVKFDGVALSIYRPAKRRCSIQVPIELRFADLIASSGQLTRQMDKYLKGSILAHNRRLKHASFIVDADDLAKIETLRNTTISLGKINRIDDCPEHEILQEIKGEYIKANGFLLSYYFPRWDITSSIELCRENISAIIFREPSQTRTPFFSEYDVFNLKRLSMLGIKVIWVNEKEALHYITRREYGFFMNEQLSRKFNYATFFACYGSAAKVSPALLKQLPAFFNELRNLFGEVGVITGGGPGLMEAVNKAATKIGILSASCCLSTELSESPQEINEHSNIVMYFNEDCRHIRQKNFGLARFPIFFPGGAGTMEEVGIEICNLKLRVRENAPYIFVGKDYWRPIQDYVKNAISKKMLGKNILENMYLVDELKEAVSIYKNFLLKPTKLLKYPHGDSAN